MYILFISAGQSMSAIISKKQIQLWLNFNQHYRALAMQNIFFFFVLKQK